MFHLAIYKPLPNGGPGSPLTTVDISPDITGLRWSTSLPGGFADMEVGLRRNSGGASMYTGLVQPLDIAPFAHVQLWYGSFLCFEGRVMRIVRPGGEIRGFSAMGYGITGLTDDFYISQDTTLKSSGFIASEVIATRCPLLVTGPNFQDPGVLHARGEYDGYAPADIINAFVSEGGYDGTVWDYYVYERREINLLPRLPPAGPPTDPPDYLIPFDERVEWSEDYTALYGQVAVRYTNLDGIAENITPRVPPTQNTAFATVYGLSRATIVEGGKLHSGAALSFGNSYLGLKQVPAYSVQVTRQNLRGLEVPGGVDAPPWTVRSGKWVGIGDQPFLPIIHTEYDASAQSLVVEAGSPLPSGSNLVRGISKVSNHVVRGTNPNTGARSS